MIFIAVIADYFDIDDETAADHVLIENILSPRYRADRGCRFISEISYRY